MIEHMRHVAAACAFTLGASTVFAVLMALTTTSREQEAWTVAATLLFVPALVLGAAWAILAARKPDVRS
jgi:hypothetical protein